MCRQPTGLMKAVGPLLGLYVWQPTGPVKPIGPSLGCMFATYRPYHGCCTAFRAACWQPTVSPLLDSLWSCMLATYMPYEGCLTAFRALCWQPTGLMTAVGPRLGLSVGNLQAL